MKQTNICRLSGDIKNNNSICNNKNRRSLVTLFFNTHLVLTRNVLQYVSVF